MVAFARSPIRGASGRAGFDPWIEGYQSRFAYLARSVNPYDLNTNARQLWDDGWMEAAAEAEKKAERQDAENAKVGLRGFM